VHAADTNTIAGWTTQDFERGRIYVPTGGDAVYVPAILTNAMPFISHTAGSATKPIDIAMDFYEIGWPVSDPDWSLDAENPTWVFQRFDQRNHCFRQVGFRAVERGDVAAAFPADLVL
jgi:hypothetical protein